MKNYYHYLNFISQLHSASPQSCNMPPKTSGKAAVKSGKAAKAVTKGDKKKRKGKRKESYAIYIYKVSYLYLATWLLTLASAGAEAGSP